jgi:hypothetical protein
LNIQFSLRYDFHFVSLVLKYAYTITAPLDHPTVDIYSHLTWNEVVPLKMSVFVWRLLNKRILTKDNLNHRGMVPSSSLFCSRGCGKDKTSNYLFFGCDFFFFLQCLESCSSMARYLFCKSSRHWRPCSVIWWCLSL